MAVEFEFAHQLHLSGVAPDGRNNEEVFKELLNLPGGFQEKLNSWHDSDRDASWEEIYDPTCEAMNEDPKYAPPKGYFWDHN